jgi:hypothetical protein
VALRPRRIRLAGALFLTGLVTAAAAAGFVLGDAGAGVLERMALSVESWHDRFGHPRQERTEQHPSNSSRWARWRTGSQSDGARERVQAVVVAYESGLVRPEGS